ncbi:MAG TPA: hypothetical protein VFU94_14620 [Conexibacter sp.]|nr:hypothetical protein [Conexibacter sp.]
MGLDVARIEPSAFETAPGHAARGARTAAAADARDAADVSSAAIPDSPPAEVLDAIGAAGRVAHELRADGRELRFVPASESGDGRVRVELRDLDGTVLRTIPPSEALDVATGTPLRED